MSFEIITVTNRKPTAPYYCYDEFHSSLLKHGVCANVLGFDEPWGGLMTKPKTLLKNLKSRHAASLPDCIMAVDSWDLVFTQSPRRLYDEWADLGRPWMAGAERNLFPPAEESRWPKCGSSYRFLNSGFIISTPDEMIAVLESMDLDNAPNDGEDHADPHPNDQEYYQRAFLKQPVPMRLDTDTRFVWNLHGVDLSNFEFGEGIIRNRETGTAPYCIHFNGNSKDTPPEMRPMILKHLQLA